MINSLKYHVYTATIRYSSDDEVFFGRVTGLNDLITFKGISVMKLKKAFRDAIEDYLEICEAINNLSI